jgi:hypothetical protein
MTYRQGDEIVAIDFNTFRTDVLNVWDVGNGQIGYGQIDTGGASAIPTASIGADVDSIEWEAFRIAAQACSDHQGSSTTFPPASELLPAEVVEAHEPLDGNPYDIPGGLNIITANGLLFDAGDVSLFSNVLNDSRGSSWSSQLTHRFTVDFPTVDDARYFFNSGGQIRIRGSRTSGSANSQNTNWTNLLAAMGTIIFDYTNTTLVGTGTNWSVNAIGYYDLTGSFQNIATGVGTGAYSSNQATIDVRYLDGPTGPNGDNGRNLDFRVRYTDNHTNGFFDSVNGTIRSDVDYQIASNPGELVIQIPAFATTTSLSSGS